MKEVNVAEAGTLSTLIPEDEVYTTTDLKVTGDLNGTDILFLREMAGTDKTSFPTGGSLARLDLSGATVKSGGDAYLEEFGVPYYTVDDEISYNMFYRCMALEKIVLPTSVKTIGVEAFRNCTSLSEVVLPDGLKTIGDRAFYYCWNLANINLPEGLESIGEDAFWACVFKEITLPSSLTYLDPSAFNSCESLENVFVEEGNKAYTSVDGVLFNAAKNKLLLYASGRTASEYSVPEGIDTISDYSFYFNQNLVSVKIPTGVKAILESAFNTCTSLEDVDFPEGLSYIGRYGFGSCANLKQIILPNSLDSIGESCFFSCSSVDSLFIPEKLAVIPNSAFSGLGIHRLYIPSTVKKIGESAFWVEDNLTEIYSYAEKPAECHETAFAMVDDKACRLLVPKGCVDAYRANVGFKHFLNIEEMAGGTSGIDNVMGGNAESETAFYGIDGKKLGAKKRGLNIVRMGDGSVRKVLCK